MKIKLLHCQFTGPRKAEITTLHEPSCLSRLFGARMAVGRFVGWCTVWHQLPNHTRVSSEMERILFDFWHKSKWEQDV
jgi:hypothetical protein